MQTHGGEIEIREIIARAINLKQGVERFTTAEWIMGDAQPKLLSLTWEIPFRSKTSQPNFALGIFFAGAFGIMPERSRFGIGAFLSRLLFRIGLVGEPQIFRVVPAIAFRPTAKARPIFLRGKSIGDFACRVR